MEYEDLGYSAVHGIISAVIGTSITYGVHMLVSPSGDIQWALIAVAVASFFSGLFSSFYSK